MTESVMASAPEGIGEPSSRVVAYRNRIETVMGSLNNDSYAATASLIIASIAAAFASPVIELSKVGVMTRAPLAPLATTGPFVATVVVPSGAASERTSVDSSLTWSARPTASGIPPPWSRGVAHTLGAHAVAIATASVPAQKPRRDASTRLLILPFLLVWVNLLGAKSPLGPGDSGSDPSNYLTRAIS